MWRQVKKERSYALIVLFCILCLFCLPVREGLTEEATLSIEKLTEGKVKVGDTITKENVDLVKHLITPGVYELVNSGLVMVIGKPYAPWESLPKWYREETERIHKEYGEPIVDENYVVWTKDKKPWPGGLTFINPKTVGEVVGSIYYFHGCDSFYGNGGLTFVNSEGKAYKNVIMPAERRYAYGRLNEAPLGSVPGQEKEDHRQCAVATYPRELKGLGQLTIRHYDLGKYTDEGFAYLPAFKRVIRISASTYQDNQAGGDNTFGDLGAGVAEPQYFFNFKLIEKKPMLVPEYSAPMAKLKPDMSSFDIFQPWDVGHKYPRLNWRLIEANIVEATPKAKHVYAKRIMCISDPKYFLAYAGNANTCDNYDSQMKLWKCFLTDGHECPMKIRGEPLNTVRLQYTHDFQADHTTVLHAPIHSINEGGSPAGLTLKLLISRGK